MERRKESRGSPASKRAPETCSLGAQYSTAQEGRDAVQNNTALLALTSELLPYCIQNIEKAKRSLKDKKRELSRPENRVKKSLTVLGPIGSSAANSLMQHLNEAIGFVCLFLLLYSTVERLLHSNR